MEVKRKDYNKVMQIPLGMLHLAGISRGNRISNKRGLV
jgi:hypothetical protein